MNRNTVALKQFSVIVAALTYAAAVVYGDIMFLSVVRVAFPHGGMLETLAYAGAVVTAVSALILPIALHWWFAPGLQFLGGIAFWFVDIAALMLNSVLAYQISVGAVDSLLQAWQALAPATPMLAVVGWGLLFLLDPSHKLRHAQSELEADQIDIYAARLREAARSGVVDSELSAGAQESARNYAYLLAQAPAVVRAPKRVGEGASAVPGKVAPATAVEPSRNGSGANSPNP